MRLPIDFHFSQGSLQDYVDCPRRFQLRHLMRLAWPAIIAEPPLDNERFMKQGAAFHRLLQQHLLGVPCDRLESMHMDPELRQWWENYLYPQPDPQGGLPEGLAAALKSSGNLCLTEITLSAPLCDHRLVGKFDALVLEGTGTGPCLKIFEWKTSHKRGNPQSLAKRLQSRVYPYLLVRASRCFNDGLGISPEQVEMIYWFAGFPTQAQCYVYDQKIYAIDSEYLESLVLEIEARGETTFPMAREIKTCRYCTYRSLCERGVRAGDLFDDEMENEAEASLAEEAPGIEFDFEQVGEIRF
jgi:hypothetical protein